MSASPDRSVDPARWRAAVADARAEGFAFLADLTAVDEVGRSDHLRVILRLENPDHRTRLTMSVLVPRDDPTLADVADVFAGAAWLQRQVHDLYGVRFDGGDDRPLIHHGGGAPMRKDVLLAPRQETRWPGALEPGESDQSPSRRKLVPPGVPDPALLADPSTTPADLAMSATGARVRRGR